MTEVIKDTFETRMKIREFDTNIKKLVKKIDLIEKRLEFLENRQRPEIYNE